MVPELLLDRRRVLFLRLLPAIVALFLVVRWRAAAANLPPPPTAYFTDYAGIVRPDTVRLLNQRLEEFERATSNQLLVVVFPNLPTDVALDDYTQDVFRAWRPGQKGRDNGAIFFVFVKDRKMRIQTGRGLEGALPDAICKRIISDEVAPRFQQGDFDGGLVAGVNAMIAATKGEYTGTGRTVAENQQHGAETEGSVGFWVLVILIFLIFAYLNSRARQRGVVYSGRGSRGMWIGPIGGGWGGGGGFGGGGFGGGGGFSGGGGDSGGGGASGGW